MRISLVIITGLFMLKAIYFAEFSSKLDLSDAAVERGRAAFMTTCVQCHGLKYYADKEYKHGVKPVIDPGSAKEAFGKIPPDLSLMAIARGKGINGAIFISNILTSYYTDEKGNVRNRAFAAYTRSSGEIAMPQPIPENDPQLRQKADDVAVFLLSVAKPAAAERTHLGGYVMGYMTIMTALLYVIYRLIWYGVKKKLG